MKARDNLTGRALGAAVGASESKISRMLKGEVMAPDLIEAVSSFLNIKNPFAPDDAATTTHAPKPTDSAEEIIRKNLIRAREQAGFDQLSAADATGIAFDTLRSYEAGEVEIPNAALRTIAPVYGRKPGDFFEVDLPPVDLDGAKRVFFRGRPEDLQALSAEDLARAAALERELDEKIRASKRAQLDHFKKARAQKGKR